MAGSKKIKKMERMEYEVASTFFSHYEFLGAKNLENLRLLMAREVNRISSFIEEHKTSENDIVHFFRVSGDDWDDDSLSITIYKVESDEEFEERKKKEQEAREAAEGHKKRIKEDDKYKLWLEQKDAFDLFLKLQEKMKSV